ncbi:hypothetical protein M011DRAFT_473654 [Sporormia fimetaria CBS 119925]|uniref:Uncharacterized protein n=1 Tax=Sporormia fimetaria CBS 119925 TaxID=1340428 RepID=A0A6A6VNK9_9PLEO|nr:hypothetical protein M011DRAFT_473654 [Sporormia fimetaria CBS 119925]
MQALNLNLSTEEEVRVTAVICEARLEEITTLKQEKQRLAEQISGLEQANARLVEENAQSRQPNSHSTTNEQLVQEAGRLTEENKRLREEISRRTTNEQLAQGNARLEEENKRLRNARLTQENTRLSKQRQEESKRHFETKQELSDLRNREKQLMQEKTLLEARLATSGKSPAVLLDLTNDDMEDSDSETGGTDDHIPQPLTQPDNTPDADCDFSEKIPKLFSWGKRPAERVEYFKLEDFDEGERKSILDNLKKIVNRSDQTRRAFESMCNPKTTKHISKANAASHTS